MRPTSIKPRRDFSMIELLVVFIVFGLVVMISIRSVGDTIRRERASKAASILGADIEQAFAIAARQRTPIMLVLDRLNRKISIIDRGTTTKIYRQRSFSRTSDYGVDSLYAIDYAARVALELGADVVKLNVPEHDKISPDQPKPYNEMNEGYAGSIARVVHSAGRALVLFSGGSKLDDEDLFMKARMAMENGATGLIFGRNLWQRPMDEALAMSQRIAELMKSV